VEDALIQNLCEAFQVLRSKEEVHQFLSDLMTPREFANLAIRFEIFRLCSQGLPRKEIQERLRSEKGAPSLATISRANTALDFGTGLVQVVVDRLEQE
jgi:TrpR-related protein YerC/YecD